MIKNNNNIYNRLTDLTNILRIYVHNNLKLRKRKFLGD